MLPSRPTHPSRSQGAEPSPWEVLQAELKAQPRSWLVTGAAGFVGSHLVESLLRLGQRVRGLDDFSTGFRKNLLEVEEIVGASAWSRFEFQRGDIRAERVCVRAVRGVDYVLHQAALSSVPRSLDEPALVFSVNLDGFANVLRAARDAGCRRVVYASSSSVYGGMGGQPQTEGAAPVVRSPYAASKLAGELLVSGMSGGGGCALPLGLRYFNLFGPRQNPRGPYAAVIPAWLMAFAERRAPSIHGAGSQMRDFTPVANAVQANLLAARVPAQVRGVFNCGTGRATGLLPLEAALRAAWSVGDPLLPAPRHGDPRPGDVRRSQADLRRARELLGYHPTVELEDGLRATVAWFRRGFVKEPLTPAPGRRPGVYHL